MITELRHLTMSQYVELVCGDTSVLNATKLPRAKAAEACRKIMFEYLSLSNPSEYAALIARYRDEMVDKMTYTMFAILLNLVQIEEYEAVRSILAEYGIGADGMTDRQLAAEVDRRMRRARADVERREIEEPEVTKDMTPGQIRRSYDRQAASLMTYFKFQIDMNTIKATTFACMTDQADREIKARMAAAKK